MKSLPNFISNSEEIIDQINANMNVNDYNYDVWKFSGTVLTKQNTMPYPAIHEVLRKIHNAGKEYATSLGFPEAKLEPVHYTKYLRNDGYFNEHRDAGGNGRVVSAVLYLNTLARGGETEFVLDEGRYKIRPEEGKLIMFSSDLLHSANMPESSDKHILAAWFTLGNIELELDF